MGFDKKCSLAVARRRHLAIRERVEAHPCTKADLEDIFAELNGKHTTPNGKAINVRYKVLSRTLANMVRRREIGIVGTVEGDIGSPPQNLYAVERVPVSRAMHDWFLTRYFRALGWPKVRRGGDVEPIEVYDGAKLKFTIRPDASRVFPTGKQGYYEMDMATEDKPDIDLKVEGYRTVKRAVLFITITEARLDKLMRWTEGLKGFSFFCLWREAVAKPRGNIWSDHHGNKISLEP